MSFAPINLPIGTSPIPGIIQKKSITNQNITSVPTPGISEDINRDAVLFDNNQEIYGPIDNRARIDPVLESLSPSDGIKIYSFPAELYFQNELSRIPFIEITAYDVSSEGFENNYNSNNSGFSLPDVKVNQSKSFAEQFSELANNLSFTDFVTASILNLSDQATKNFPILKETTRLRDKKLTPLVKMRLPAPPNLESNYSLKYTDNEGVGSAKRLSEIVSSTLSDNNIPNYIIKQGSAGIVSNIVSSIVGSSGVGKSILAGDPNYVDYIRFQSRTIPTPLLEYTFEGIDRRKFTFTWKMYAKSSKEAADIYNIILNLKKYAHPSALVNFNTSEGNSSVDKFYIRYPKVFTMKHLYLREDNLIVENLYINRIKPCVITNIKVNYTDSNTFLLFNKAIEMDGNENYRAPIGLELSISLTELELLMAEDFDVNSQSTNLFTEGGY